MEQSHLVALILILALSLLQHRLIASNLDVLYAHTYNLIHHILYTKYMKMPRHNSGSTSSEFAVLTQITHMFPLQVHPSPSLSSTSYLVTMVALGVTLSTYFKKLSSLI